MHVLLLFLGLFGFRDLGVDLNKAFKMNVPIFKTLSCEVCWWPQAAEEIVTISAMHHSVKCTCVVRSRGGWGKQEAEISSFTQPMSSILLVHWALETSMPLFKICSGGMSPHHLTCNIFIRFWLHNVYLGGKASLNISGFVIPAAQNTRTAHEPHVPVMVVMQKWH